MQSSLGHGDLLASIAQLVVEQVISCSLLFFAVPPNLSVSSVVLPRRVRCGWAHREFSCQVCMPAPPECAISDFANFYLGGGGGDEGELSLTSDTPSAQSSGCHFDGRRNHRQRRHGKRPPHFSD
eukprot:scaffold1954_cov268-Pinguiococcus_pyrenoidosus.AAC.251